MKYRHMAAFIAVLFSAGCSFTTQDPNATLYETRIPVDSPVGAEKVFSMQMLIGPTEKQVPVQIVWSAIQDSAGCFKISHIKFSRVGGDASMVISDVRHSTIPQCMMKFESEDKTRFQAIVINAHYETRILIKSYDFDGSIATIRGNGEFIRN